MACSASFFHQLIFLSSTEQPDTKHIIKLFRERNLRQLPEVVNCSYFKTFQFTEANDCEIIDTIEQIATPLLQEFKDVIQVGESRLVFLESLNKIPQEALGDLTGDYGKQLARFLRDCLDKKLITNVGAVFDIGGQNISTIQLISDLLSDQALPSIIVDINSITPGMCCVTL